jgi:hypothetical protein
VLGEASLCVPIEWQLSSDPLHQTGSTCSPLRIRQRRLSTSQAVAG